MATPRQLETHEKEWWERRGWIVEIAPPMWVWGSKFPARWDFFSLKEGRKRKRKGFDLIALRLTPRLACALIQVSKSPGANANHGAPRFEMRPPEHSVEVWAESPDGIAQVIVSYADPKNPVRNWWVRRNGGRAKTGLDRFA